MESDALSIFPTNSPIERNFGGTTGLKAPKPLEGEVFDSRYKKLLKRIRPLLEVKEETDRVYANGYFENHYPAADKKLKKLLHQKAMDAWARAITKEEKEEKEEKESDHGRVMITISLGR